MHHPSRRLALVANLPEPDRDPNEAQPAADVTYRLGEILRERLWTGAVDATDPIPLLSGSPSVDRLPFAIRMTMAQVLEVAEDAEIRAEVLHDLASTFVAARDGTDRRVNSLREVAVDLRKIAAQMFAAQAVQRGGTLLAEPGEELPRP